MSIFLPCLLYVFLPCPSFCLSVCMSVCLPARLSFSPVHLSVFLFRSFVCLPSYSVCMSVYLSCPSVCLFGCLTIRPTNLSVCLAVCLFVLPICLYVWLSDLLPFCLSNSYQLSVLLPANWSILPPALLSALLSFRLAI